MKTGTPFRNSFDYRQDKDTTDYLISTQIMLYLWNQDATVSMLAYATGWPKQTIRWYTWGLEKSGLLWKVERAYCKISGRRAWYLTTNPDKALSVSPDNKPQ